MCCLTVRRGPSVAIADSGSVVASGASRGARRGTVASVASGDFVSTGITDLVGLADWRPPKVTISCAYPAVEFDELFVSTTLVASR